MPTLFADLCAFFGISGAPSDMAELIPWFFQVGLCICVVWGVYRFFRAVATSINRGGRF